MVAASGDCVTLSSPKNGSLCNGDVCQECNGGKVCGDGIHYGTVSGSSYACASGVVGTATACTYGCDADTGLCADIVAASQAQQHLAVGDAFTCTGTQSANLPAIAVAAGTTITFNTTARTITNGGAAVTNAQWGAGYAPTSSGTEAIVVHVKSLTLGDGATMTITGEDALIVLVDQDFTATGTQTNPTIISVAANLNTAGPGGNSTTAKGGGGTGTNSAGGGGAAHGAAGAIGGDGNNTTTGAGTAGASYSVAAKTEVLEAGEAGGAGSAAAAAGAGGGALQITACGAISIGADVVVNASGGGGAAGTAGIALTAGTGGGGGGSGGTILLEASSFSIAGSLVANGGGGGGGGPSSGGQASTAGQNWSNGKPGSTSVTTPAQGGTCPGVATNPGTGGPGAVGSAAAGAGANAAANAGGGGGGGALGVIFLNVPPGTAAPTVGAASPAIVTSTACVTVGGKAPATCTY